MVLFHIGPLSPTTEIELSVSVGKPRPGAHPIVLGVAFLFHKRRRWYKMTGFPFGYRKALMLTEKILVVKNKRNTYDVPNVKHKLLRIRILPYCRVSRVLQKYCRMLSQGQVRKIKNENRRLSLVPAAISQCGSKANKKNLLWYNNLCNFMIHNLKHYLYIKVKFW